MAIVFKGGDGEHIFSLSNFVNKQAEHEIFEYAFHYESDGFNITKTLEAEVFDLKYFLKGLHILNNSLKGGCSFEPMINQQLNIRLQLNDQGHLSVDGIISDCQFSTRLTFRLISDQSFISDLISQCTMAVNLLK